MEKFYNLHNEYLLEIAPIKINKIWAKNRDDAWKVVEDDIANNNSSDWLLTEKEFKLLKAYINEIT